MEFPKLDGGWCDGLGCGGPLCFCKEQLAMQERVQELKQIPWGELPKEEQKIFEESFYQTFNECKRIVEQQSKVIDDLRSKLITKFLGEENETGY